jgi:hypothetical protein
MDLLRDVWDFLRTRKKYWLLPALVVIIGLSVLTAISSATVAAPLIYTIF